MTEQSKMGRFVRADFGQLSTTQIDALANVAFGAHGAGVSRSTLNSLERGGFIQAYSASNRFTRGMRFVWTQWQMPLAVHVAFCQWCSEQELS